MRDTPKSLRPYGCKRVHTLGSDEGVVQSKSHEWFTELSQIELEEARDVVGVGLVVKGDALPCAGNGKDGYMPN